MEAFSTTPLGDFGPSTVGGWEVAPFSASRSMYSEGEMSGVYRALVTRLSVFADLLGAMARGNKLDRATILDDLRWRNPH